MSIHWVRFIEDFVEANLPHAVITDRGKINQAGRRITETEVTALYWDYLRKTRLMVPFHSEIPLTFIKEAIRRQS